jgi:hypothetical protein
MLEQLRAQTPPFATASFTFAGNAKMVEGQEAADVISPRAGVVRYNEFDTLAPDVLDLTSHVSSSHFIESYNQHINSALNRTEALGRALEQVSLNATFPPQAGRTAMRGLELTAQIIKLRSTLGKDRVVFFAEHVGAGHDAHGADNEVLNQNMQTLDQSLQEFVREMRTQGIWENVVVGARAARPPVHFLQPLTCVASCASQWRPPSLAGRSRATG